MADQLSLRLINWIKAQMYSEHAFPVKWFKKHLRWKCDLQSEFSFS